MMPITTHAEVMQSYEAERTQAYIQRVNNTISTTIPSFATTLPEGLEPYEVIQQVPQESIEGLNRILRSDDHPGGYNILYAHRGAFNLNDLPHPATATPEVKNIVGAHFIETARQFKDKPEELAKLILNMNTGHHNNSPPPSQPHP